MHGTTYLIACLKECKEDTTISYGGYNTLFKAYEVQKDSVTIHTTDNKSITVYSNNRYVWSEYDEEYNVLEIQY